jgi:hypothetical protein
MAWRGRRGSETGFHDEAEAPDDQKIVTSLFSTIHIDSFY